MPSKSIASPEATVAYAVSGSGAGMPLVLVHGWGCSRRDWDGVIAALGDDYLTVAIDLPGHGESTTTANELSVGSYADNVAAVLDAEGISNAAVAGHSMGGAVVLELAARRPDLVSQVIGVDTYHYLQVYPAQAEELIAGFLGTFTSDLDAGIASLIELSSIPTTSAEIKKRVSDSLHAADFPLVLTALGDSLRWDLDATLESVAVPVSSIVAESLVADEARERYSGEIEFVDFPGVSHYLLLEDPQGSAERISDLLASA